MSLWRRSLAVLVALGSLTLAGCSSPVTGGTGIFVEDGHVHAIVQMCPDATANSVSLTRALPPNYFWETTVWRFDDARSATIDLGTVGEFIDRLSEKGMQLSSNASYGVGGWVKFDAADIRALTDGEILSFSWSTDGTVTFDKPAFEAEAVLYCDGI